jgi:hypothetical protein
MRLPMCNFYTIGETAPEVCVRHEIIVIGNLDGWEFTKFSPGRIEICD